MPQSCHLQVTNTSLAAAVAAAVVELLQVLLAPLEVDGRDFWWWLRSPVPDWLLSPPLQGKLPELELAALSSALGLLEPTSAEELAEEEGTAKDAEEEEKEGEAGIREV